jgi:fructose-1,6-bisphosphatase/inositol monophosphatase family enzyme
MTSPVGWAPDLIHAPELADQANAPFRMLDLSIETKRNLTPVTEADRAIERALPERVASAWPDEGIYSDKPSGECAHFRDFGACALNLKAP